MENTTVIIGSGIIGLSTAYYLSSPSSKSKPQNIHLVESSPELFRCSSGLAGGFCAEDWFSPTVAPLGALSFALHRSLANSNNGREKWGYCSSTAVSLTQDTTDDQESAIGGNGADWLQEGNSRAAAAGTQDVGKGEGPGWLRPEAGSLEGISGEGTVAQVDPMRLCQWLLEECLSRGVVLHQPASVVNVARDREGILTGVKIRRAKAGAETDVPCTHILLTAGPWTPSVFKSLFPTSHLKIPVSALAGHSLLVKSPRWTSAQEQKGCHAVFATDTLGFSPEVFSRLGEELYLTGLNSTHIPLPALPTEVVARKEDLKQLRDVAKGMLGGKEDDLVVLRESLCFRPVTSSGRPIISRVPDDELGGLITRGGGDGGVFVAAGHGAWGISQSLGTGAVLAELMEGRPTSVSIEGLAF